MQPRAHDGGRRRDGGGDARRHDLESGATRAAPATATSTLVGLQRTAGNAAVARALAASPPRHGALLRQPPEGGTVAPPRPTTQPPVGGRGAPPRPQRPAPTTAKAPIDAKFLLREITFHTVAEWVAAVTGLSDPTGVGSVSLSATFGVSTGTGIPNVIDATVGVPITLAGGLNVGDDRRFRVQGSVTIGLDAELAFLSKLWTISAGVSTTLSVSGTYQDHLHFTANLLRKIAKLVKGFKKTILRAAKDRPVDVDEVARNLNRGMAMPEGYQELADVPMIGHSRAIAVGASASTDLGGLLGAGVSVSKAKTFSYRTERDRSSGEKRKLTKTGHTESLAMDFSLGLPAGVSLGVGVSWVNIVRDANPDNDGEYLTLTLSPSAPVPWLSTAVHVVGTAIADALRKPPETTLKDRLAAVLKGLSTSSATGLGDAGVPGMDSGAGVSFAFVKDSAVGGWDLMYTRFTASRSFAHEVDVKAWALPGLEVGAKVGVDLSQDSGMGEVLGANLAYLRAVYNGLLNRGVRGRQQWETYKAAQKGSLAAIVVAAGTPGTSAYAEAHAFDGNVKRPSRAPASEIEAFELQSFDARLARAQGFAAACDAAVRAGKAQDPATRAQLLKLLDDYLWTYRLKTAAEGAKEWVSASKLGARIDVTAGRPTAVLTKTVKGESTDWMHTLGDAIDRNYRIDLALRMTDTDKVHKLDLTLRGPVEEAREEFRKAVRSRFKTRRSFPANLALLDSDLRAVWLSFSRSERDAKAGVKVDAAREAQWRSALETRLDAVLDRLLEAPVGT